MRDDERRRRDDDEPEEEQFEMFAFGEESEEDDIERLKRLFGESDEFAEEVNPERGFDKGRELEVRVTGVYERYIPGEPRALLVQLRDNLGRTVPIVIGPFEAQAIWLALSEDSPARPLTHDLMRNILQKLGVGIDRVVIDDLWQGTFYAKIYLLQGDEEIEIDSRPSDAIALALRFRAPIYMSESVLEQEGIQEDFS
ncbi:MAG: bifunctional nuclease family protein [Fimbriimonadales bacterium]